MRYALGVVVGDAAGIGPEVTVKALQAVSVEGVSLVVAGDARTIARALSITGGSLPFSPYSPESRAPLQLLDTANADVSCLGAGRPCEGTAKAVVEDLRLCMDMMEKGELQGLAFAPLDKKTFKSVVPGFRDEHEFFADHLKAAEPGDAINVLDGVWAGRVTSHIPFKEIAETLSVERVFATISRIDAYLRAAGNATPKIAVSALNPHCGEGGACGREEIDIINPAIRKAVEAGIRAEGPIPADSICIRTFLQKEFDGIVSMYHDQAQTGIKLLARRRSITVTGGVPYPICTTSHGTGYDLVGKGTASSASMEQAIATASQMILSLR